MTPHARYDGPERRKFAAAEELEEFYEVLDGYHRRISALESRTSEEARAEFRLECADAVFKSVYEDIGRNVVHALLWALGLAFTALFAWLAATGKVKL